MTLRNVFLIARRDYVAYVGRRRFWISLMFSPTILLGFMFVPVLIQDFQTAPNYAVVDHSGWLLNAVDQHIAADDYARLLTLAAHTPASSRNTLPAVLADLAPAAAQLSDAGRKALALAMATGNPAPAAAPALTIWMQRDALIRWYQGLSAAQASKFDRGLAIARYHRVSIAPDELRDAVTQGDLFAYFVLPADPLNADTKFTYASRNLTDTALHDWFSDQISSVVRARKAAQTGLSPDKTQWLDQPVVFQDQLVTKAGAENATDAEKAAQWVPVGYVYLLFISIMSIAQLLMMALIEEKSNRIAETLLSSVESIDIMAGKTLGVAAVGITLITGWLTIILGVLAAFSSALPVGGFAYAILAGVSAWAIVWFIIYFLLGFLLYAAVLGTVGAAVNNIREAQPYMMPVMMFLMLPLILMVPIAKDPTATWARVLSYIPPLTPFLMMNRSAAPPPMIDYVATTALLLLSVSIAFYASARIFRTGLLNTGAPPKLKEMLSWMRKPK